MTKAELDAIRARVEAATPGPWGIDDEFVVFSHSATFADGSGYEQHVRVCEIPHWMSSGAIRERDADLITNAPTDLCALLAEVERLTVERNAIAKKAVQEWKDASGYDDLLTAYSAASHERDLARNRLEAWKSCLHCGNTRADGDFWENHCPACKHEDRKVNAAFRRGVAAMREAARLYFVGKAGEAFAEHDDAEERRQLRNAKAIRALPDPEDRP